VDDSKKSMTKRGASWGLRVLVCASAICAVAFLCARGLRLTVPSWVAWQQRTVSCDLDGDGASETLSLTRRRVRVTGADGTTLYESDGTWRVSDVLAADVTGDGHPELVMLLWRRGNYGNSRPFWESGIDPRMTQHVYVMGLEGGAMQPVWMGHELGEGLKVSQMKATEDGLLELTTTDGQTSTWEWDYFGFSLVE
jgi:hypothetical protein